MEALMRKRYKFFISVLIVFALGGCSKREDIIVYTGYGESWLATYSSSLIEDTVYDSLMIQYLYGHESLDEVLTLDYRLEGGSFTISSSFPQNLQGNGSFHTTTRFSAESFEQMEDKKVQLTIEWNGEREVIDLKRVN